VGFVQIQFVTGIVQKIIDHSWAARAQLLKEYRSLGRYV